MVGINVTSEIGTLRKVLVHAPGPELLAVTPSNREEFLYDDIIDMELALEEHRRFTSILSRFAEVYQIRELLEETLENQEAREFLFTRSEEVTANRSIRTGLGSESAAKLAERYIEGWRQPVGRFAEALQRQSWVLPPLPNCYFTRDSAVVVGEDVIISSMRFAPRWPEEAMVRTIFGFHPELGNPRVLYDGSDERRHGFRLEGGDVHPLSPEVVLIGLSQRTSAATVDELTEMFFRDTKITDVIAVVLPDAANAIHLDMVWTQLDRGQCLAYPPTFQGPTRVPVLHRRRGETSVTQPDTIFEALKRVGLAMEPVWAGGERQETREREQWASGCNSFAVAPGQIVSYARNEETLKALEAAGFRMVEGEELLLGDDEVQEDERFVVTFYGSELVRGGGGPRCMTCPLVREPT